MHKYYKSLLLIFGLTMISFTQSSTNSRIKRTFQCNPTPIENDEVVIIDHYDNAQGYYIFKSGKTSPKNVRSMVVLIHGYGALNPAIFGAWIKHLIEDGNIVVYPRYQTNLVSPSTTKFTDNTAEALRNALNELDKLGYKELPLVYAGHSFGGVIASNLTALSVEKGLPKPHSVLVAEGGTGPFTAAQLETYEDIPEDIPFVVVVGANDWTVGSAFADRLYNELPGNGESAYILQRGLKMGENMVLSASHYEPYSMDSWCDNGMHNFTYKRALQVAKLDVLNVRGYWHWLDVLVERVVEQVPVSSKKLLGPMEEIFGDTARQILQVKMFESTISKLSQG